MSFCHSKIFDFYRFKASRSSSRHQITTSLISQGKVTSLVRYLIGLVNQPIIHLPVQDNKNNYFP